MLASRAQGHRAVYTCPIRRWSTRSG
jgi:hypothetical protein